MRISINKVENGWQIEATWYDPYKRKEWVFISWAGVIYFLVKLGVDSGYWKPV